MRVKSGNNGVLVQFFVFVYDEAMTMILVEIRQGEQTPRLLANSAGNLLFDMLI